MNGLRKVLHIFKSGQGLVKWIWDGGEVPFLVLVVGQNCSLKCCDCANLAPYAPKSHLAYSSEKILSDLDIFTSIIGSILCLQIQGGEPFIYPDIDRIIKYVGKNKKYYNNNK